MSRSNPVEKNSHPCHLWLEWKGGPGVLSYWDKNRGDNGERVEIDVTKKPFRFIYLDQTSTVRGYSKVRKCGVFSNEIRDTRIEPFVVKFFDGKEVIANGLWNDIKDTVTSKRNGGGFGKNVYVAYKEGAELRVGCIQMTGCALGPWFEFFDSNKKAVEARGVVMARGDKDVSGDVEFHPPVFALCDVSPETDNAAKKLDVDLQAFLADYFAKSNAPKAPATTPANTAGRSVQSAPTDRYDAQPDAPPDEPPIDHAPPEDDIPF